MISEESQQSTSIQELPVFQILSMVLWLIKGYKPEYLIKNNTTIRLSRTKKPTNDNEIIISVNNFKCRRTAYVIVSLDEDEKLIFTDYVHNSVKYELDQIINFVKHKCYCDHDFQ